MTRHHLRGFLLMKKDMRTILHLLFLMLALTVVYALVGCTRTVSKVVEVRDTVYTERTAVDSSGVVAGSVDTVYMVRTDTLRVVDHRRDSVVVRDSVYVREKGDSVFVYRERWRDRVELRHDTIVKVKTDTLVRTHTDTVRVYQFVEMKDSAHHSVSSNQETVKERKPLWFTLLKWLIPIVVVGAIVWFARKWLLGK